MLTNASVSESSVCVSLDPFQKKKGSAKQRANAGFHGFQISRNLIYAAFLKMCFTNYLKKDQNNLFGGGCSNPLLFGS